MKAKSITGKFNGRIKQHSLKSTKDGFPPTLAIILLTKRKMLINPARFLKTSVLKFLESPLPQNFTNMNSRRKTNAVMLLDINR